MVRPLSEMTALVKTVLVSKRMGVSDHQYNKMLETNIQIKGLIWLMPLEVSKMKGSFHWAYDKVGYQGKTKPLTAPPQDSGKTKSRIFPLLS